MTDNEVQAAGVNYFQLSGNSHPSRKKVAPSPPTPRHTYSEFFIGQDQVFLILITKIKLTHRFISQSTFNHSPPHSLAETAIISSCLLMKKKKRHREFSDCSWSHSQLITEPSQSVDFLCLIVCYFIHNLFSEEPFILRMNEARESWCMVTLTESRSSGLFLSLMGGNDLGMVSKPIITGK